MSTIEVNNTDFFFSQDKLKLHLKEGRSLIVTIMFPDGSWTHLLNKLRHENNYRVYFGRFTSFISILNEIYNFYRLLISGVPGSSVK